MPKPFRNERPAGVPGGLAWKRPPMALPEGRSDAFHELAEAFNGYMKNLRHCTMITLSNFSPTTPEIGSRIVIRSGCIKFMKLYSKYLGEVF